MTSTWIVISLITLVLYVLFYRRIIKLQKQNKVSLTLGITWLLFACGSGVVFGTTIGKVFIDSISTSETECKEYIIKHSDEIRCAEGVDFTSYDKNGIQYKIDTCTMNYWTDITLSDYGDSIYVIFWGDRDSWKWHFKSDKGFWIYRPSKGNSLVYDDGEYVVREPNVLDIAIFAFLNKPQFPQPTGWVNDFEGILDAKDILTLTEMINEIEVETSVEIAVVTLCDYDTINFNNFFDYITALANNWGVGKKDLNNGVTITLSENLKQVTIQVGYGLEEKLTDAECLDIIQYVLPLFKQKMYSGGLFDMVSLIHKETK